MVRFKLWSGLKQECSKLDEDFSEVIVIRDWSWRCVPVSNFIRVSGWRDMTYPPKLPSLIGYILWKYGFKQWADNGEIKKFPNYLCGPHKPFKTKQLTTYETKDSLAATLFHWGQTSSRKQSECGRHSLSTIFKLQATFLYSIYRQRAGKTNLFHMRGGWFHAGNTLCTFKRCK